MNLFKIRPFDKVEFNALEREIKNLTGTFYAPSYPDKGEVYILKDNGKVLGYLSYSSHNFHLNDRWSVYAKGKLSLDEKEISPSRLWKCPGYDKYRRDMALVSLDYVYSSCPGKGVGTKLIDILKENSDMIELIDISGKEGFYRKKGFEDSGARIDGNKILVWCYK